jgi:hypothetical protein
MSASRVFLMVVGNRAVRIQVSIELFWGAIEPFSRSIELFWHSIESFYGSIELFSNAIELF